MTDQLFSLGDIPTAPEVSLLMEIGLPGSPVAPLWTYEMIMLPDGKIVIATDDPEVILVQEVRVSAPDFRIYFRLTDGVEVLLGEPSIEMARALDELEVCTLYDITNPRPENGIRNVAVFHG